MPRTIDRMNFQKLCLSLPREQVNFSLFICIHFLPFSSMNIFKNKKSRKYFYFCLQVTDVDDNSLESNCKRKKTEDTKFDFISSESSSVILEFHDLTTKHKTCENLDEDSLLSVSSSNITPISLIEEVEKNIPVLQVEDSTFSVVNPSPENSNIIDNVRL